MGRFGYTAILAAILLGTANLPLSIAQDVQRPTLAGSLPALPRSAPDPSPQVLALRADLDRLVRGAASRNADYGILVVSVDRRDTLFSHNADLPLAPASNLKLYSTAAALYYLGPSFRYSTYALADGAIEDGSIKGDLVLYGTGDPTISSRMLAGALVPLRALADSLARLGVREIQGDIVGDGSYFDDRWIGEGWRERYRLAAYSAPVGALSLAENIVSVRVRPGSAVGQPAQIVTTPATDGLLVRNRVQTVSSGSSRVSFAYDPEGITIEGQLRPGHPGVARTVTVVDPGNYAAAVFRQILENEGVEVRGTVRTIRDAADSPIGRATRAPSGTKGVRPPPRVIGTHLSPTLAEIVSVTNHISQNLYAESMFKTVGRVAIGEGSFVAASEAIQYLLECEQPFNPAGINIVDGSGLSPLNRVTARSTIHLLDLMTRTDVWEPFFNSLPEASSSEGGRHSLRNRMGGTAAAQNLRAKTGTIDGVSALSGYVRADNGELLAFSIMGNDLGPTWPAKRLEDNIGARLANFTRPEPEIDLPEAEPASGLVPATPAPTGPDTVESLPDTDVPAPAPPPAAPPESAAPRTTTHTVTAGENFSTIARRYGTTTAELQRLNPGIEPQRLQVGAELTVSGVAPRAPSSPPTQAPSPSSTPPPVAAAARTHRVTSGENFGSIAQRYGTTTTELQRLNPGIEPRSLQVGHVLTVPGEANGPAAATAPAPSANSQTRTHRVTAGENFTTIARRYGTTVSELQRLNPRIEPRRLQVGQSLTVPAQ